MGDQLLRGLKAGDVADRGQKRRAAHVDPGTVSNRRASGQTSASRAISRSTAAISASRNSVWHRAPATVFASSTGSSSSSSHLRP
jgi:hypothetical protein